MSIDCKGRCPVVVNDTAWQKGGKRTCCRKPMGRRRSQFFPLNCDIHQSKIWETNPSLAKNIDLNKEISPSLIGNQMVQNANNLNEKLITMQQSLTECTESAQKSNLDQQIEFNKQIEILNQQLLIEQRNVSLARQKADEAYELGQKNTRVENQFRISELESKIESQDNQQLVVPSQQDSKLLEILNLTPNDVSNVVALDALIKEMKGKTAGQITNKYKTIRYVQDLLKNLYLVWTNGLGILLEPQIQTDGKGNTKIKPYYEFLPMFSRNSIVFGNFPSEDMMEMMDISADGIIPFSRIVPSYILNDQISNLQRPVPAQLDSGEYVQPVTNDSEIVFISLANENFAWKLSKAEDGDPFGFEVKFPKTNERFLVKVLFVTSKGEQYVDDDEQKQIYNMIEKIRSTGGGSQITFNRDPLSLNISSIYQIADSERLKNSLLQLYSQNENNQRKQLT